MCGRVGEDAPMTPEQKLRRAMWRIVAVGIVAFVWLWLLPATGPACLDTSSCVVEERRRDGG